MFKKFKSIISLLAVAAFVLILFTGCGQQGGDGNESSKNENVKSDNVKSELVITRWASIYEEPAFKAWGEKFMEQYPDIKLTWRFNSYTEYFQKVQFDLLDDAAGDVIFLSTWAWNAYADSSVMMDLNTVPQLQDAISGLVDASKEQFIKKSGNERLAVPVGITARRPVINVDDFIKAGYTEQDVNALINRKSSFTAEELTKTLGDVADKLGKKYAAKFDVTEAVFLLTASAGAPIINNTTGTVDVDTDAGRAAMKELVKFMQSGYQVPFQQAVNGGLGGTFDASMLATGEYTVLTSYTGPWAFSTLANSGKNIASIPTIKAAGGTDTMLVTYNNLCIPKACKNKDAAYKFISWALSKEGQLEFAKFSDLPANKEVYDIVTEGKDAAFPVNRFGAFNVGSANVYYMPGLSTDFSSALSGALSNLLNTNYKTGNGYNDIDEAALDAAVAKACAALKSAEGKI